MQHTLTAAGSLIREDGANIPLDLANGDFVAFLDSGAAATIEDKADTSRLEALKAEYAPYQALIAERKAKADAAAAAKAAK